MTTFSQLFIELITTPSFVSALGWIFAAAVLVGGILNDGYKQLVSWITACIVYILFQELARAALLSSFGQAYRLEGMFVLLTGVIYILGLCAGWGIVHLAKAKVHRDLR